MATLLVHYSAAVAESLDDATRRAQSECNARSRTTYQMKMDERRKCGEFNLARCHLYFRVKLMTGGGPEGMDGWMDIHKYIIGVLIVVMGFI